LIDRPVFLAQTPNSVRLVNEDAKLELMEAVRREKLAVTGVFAMHMGVKPWAYIEAAVAKVQSAAQR
jgi:hypothetical protein